MPLPTINHTLVETFEMRHCYKEVWKQNPLRSRRKSKTILDVDPNPKALTAGCENDRSLRNVALETSDIWKALGWWPVRFKPCSGQHIHILLIQMLVIMWVTDFFSLAGVKKMRLWVKVNIDLSCSLSRVSSALASALDLNVLQKPCRNHK